MAKEEMIKVEGEVLESLPNHIFQVELQNKQKIMAQISGKMRAHPLRILPGDRVQIEMSPLDISKGRITALL
jgi:translation initiation factor IF-1